jgi:hypothetical protein
VHVAGNSSGFWVALELGRLQRPRTVTALDPAGLWRKSAPRYIRMAMRQARLNAKITRRVAPNEPPGDHAGLPSAEKQQVSRREPSFGHPQAEAQRLQREGETPSKIVLTI